MKVRHDKKFSRLLSVGFLLGSIAYGITCSIFTGARITGDSMEPTLKEGEYTTGIRSWLTGEPRRGDIISFRPPSGDGLYVKRVIGLPGEEVIITDGKIYIDGSMDPLVEPYLDDWTVATGPYHFNVPEGKYLVLGDNRDISYDSRDWEQPYVDLADIESRTCLVYRPVSHIRYLYGQK